jgi:hypothetical protein
MIYSLKEWQTIYKNPNELIIQASSTDENDTWQPHPIGMSYQYLNMVSLGKDIQIGDHTMLVHCSMRDSTDDVRRIGQPITRMTILETLKKNGIINRFTSYQEYFISLPNYKFVISPEGNGIDCHRHYEAIIAGCIPIMEDNIMVREKYAGLPVLYTKDYSEITQDYLISIYTNMLDMQYDFSRVFLNYYSPNEIALIKGQSSYWCKKLIGRPFYLD